MTSHVGTIPTWLTSLCDLPLLFVYFQVNNGVLYFLDYVEGIYIISIRALSVLVSILDANHMYSQQYGSMTLLFLYFVRFGGSAWRLI